MRLALAGAQARRRGRRHHHRPGRRGRRALRRGGLNRAVAAGRQGGRPGAGAGGGRYRQRPADRGGAGAGRAGRVDRLAVVDGRGVLEHPGSAGGLRQGRQPRHRPQPLVHRQAGPDAAQRLDRGLGASRTTRSRSECRCSTWFPAWRCGPPTGIPNESVDVAFNPVGQVVGQFTKVEKTSTVIERWVQEYLEATNRLDELNAAALPSERTGRRQTSRRRRRTCR